MDEQVFLSKIESLEKRISALERMLDKVNNSTESDQQGGNREIKTNKEAYNTFESIRLSTKKIDYVEDLPFEYDRSNGEIIIKKYVGFDDQCDVVVPEIIQGAQVVEIGEGVFENCKKLRNVLLPKSIVKIGKQAFKGSGIDHIDLPIGLKQIGESAFYKSSIEYIRIPPTVEAIANSTFSYTPLKEVIMSNGISSIGDEAFKGCDNLTKVDIPFGVTFIGLCAFWVMYRKKSLHIRIPESVVSIKGSKNMFISDDRFSDKITVYCRPGSEAMQFARKNSMLVKRYEEFDQLDA